MNWPEYSEESTEMAPKGKPEDAMTKADKEEIQADISKETSHIKYLKYFYSVTFCQVRFRQKIWHIS